MRKSLIVLCMVLCSIGSAAAQVAVGIGLPGVSIGINLPVYPTLVPVPGYPVYYAPQVNSNYFFYDGMYWVYQQDNWYASTWYNGPWGLVAPEAVPLFILRVPVRYYRQPPMYFRGWQSDGPPHWGEHWGNSWEQSHGGWDNWNRSSVPAAAPLPLYQRQYSGNRYPRVEQQQQLQSRNYRYQPQDAVVQQHYQAQRVQSAPASAPGGMQGAPQGRGSAQQVQRDTRPPSSVQQAAPPASRGQPPQQRSQDVQKPAVTQAPAYQAAPAQQRQAQPPQAVQRQAQPPQAVQRQAQPPQAVQRQAQPPQAVQRQAQPPQQGAQRQQEAPPRSQGKAPAQQPKQGQDKGHDKGEPQGGERNK